MAPVRRKRATYTDTSDDDDSDADYVPPEMLKPRRKGSGAPPRQELRTDAEVRDLAFKKRRREEAKQDASKKLQLASNAVAAGRTGALDPDLQELVKWQRALEELTVPKLKELCRANNLLLSGVKDELLLKIVRCKRFGGPGKCPRCGDAKLRLNVKGDSLLALPTSVECRHFDKTDDQLTSCGYRLALSRTYFREEGTKMHAEPLRDTPTGTLAALGLQPGSQILGR